MTLAEAVQEALANCGTSVLSNPTLFRNLLMDCMDVDSAERHVLRRCCDTNLLAPLARATEKGEDLKGVAPLLEYYLSDTCMINDEVSRSIACGLVDGVRLYTTAEDDSKEEEEKPLPLLPAEAGCKPTPALSVWMFARGVSYQLDSRPLHNGCASLLRLKNTCHSNVIVCASLAFASGERRHVTSTPLVPGGQGVLAFGMRVLEVESLEVLATGETSPSHSLAWHVVAQDEHGDTHKPHISISNLSGAAVQVKSVLLEIAPCMSVVRVNVPQRVLDTRETMTVPVTHDTLNAVEKAHVLKTSLANMRIYVNGARILPDTELTNVTPRARTSSSTPGMAHAHDREGRRGRVAGLRYEVVNDWVQPSGSLLFLHNDSWNVLSAEVHVRSRSVGNVHNTFDRHMTVGPMAPAEKHVVVLPTADAWVESLRVVASGGGLSRAWCCSWNRVANRKEAIQGQNIPVTRLVVVSPGHVETAMVVDKKNKKLWTASIGLELGKREGFQLIVAGELHDPLVFVDGVRIGRDENLGPSLRTKGIWGHHKNMVQQVPAGVLPLWRVYGL